MECNKDEALRAKQLAEQKMLKNEFEGAHKIALKAKQLYPELDNISQIITVCEVHCSSQKKINNTEKDLYGILQVEKTADEGSIRKQYRKLALALHPDKNKFPGAESAFKIIGEANMILSDTTKRSVYDFKCREKASVTKLQNRQENQNSNPHSRVNGQSKQQPSQPEIRVTFWTYCPFCGVKYEYYKEYINRPLRCQQCAKLFIAHDIGLHGAGPGPRGVNIASKKAEPVFPQQKDVGRREKVKVHIQKDGKFSSSFGQGTKTEDAKAGNGTKSEDTKVSDGSKTRKETGKEGVKKSNVTSKPMETGVGKDSNRKRRRKMSESGSDVEDASEGISVGSNKGNDHRRSSRQKQRVSYREDAADELSSKTGSKVKKSSDNVEEAPKKEVSGSDDKPCNTGDINKETCNQKAGSLPNEHKVKEKEAEKSSKADSESSEKLDPGFMDCLDPEFANFDKDKEEGCFAVDQIWACYDSVDSMPRFYAQIRKIYKSKFRVQLTWLEADPEKDLEKKWAEEELPISCGKFVRGETEETRDRLMFSHQITYKKGESRFSYVIYPQEGEIWALFRDWDIKWSLDPESHRKYKFDVVEILSVNDKAVTVAFLLKVKGFVSLFRRTIWAGLAEHSIPFDELFKFSHRIPAVKLTGTEREGVPAGSFELDPASLPGDFETYYYSNLDPEKEEKMGPTTGLPKTPKKNVKSETRNDHLDPKNEEQAGPGPATGLAKSSKKSVNSEARNGLNVRRSPRGLKGGDVNSTSTRTIDDYFAPKKSPKSCGISSPSSACRNLDLISHDFSSDKQLWKFKLGEIWAFWDHNDGICQSYGQIKHIQSNPPKLHVTLLKACNIPSNSSIRHHACGLFLSTGKTKVVELVSFSHIVKADASGNVVFDIHPKEQQIWGLYKKGESGEFNIVQILETNENGVKVLPLSRVPGYKSVFQAPRLQRSTGKINVIPRMELNRFSHQIPAFRFTEEKDGTLRGCWDLDPAALSGLGPNEDKITEESSSCK